MKRKQTRRYVPRPVRSSEGQLGGEVVLYRARGGKVELDVRLERDTVWLSLNEMAELFARDKSVVSRHLDNIFKSRELLRSATVAKAATVRREGDRDVVRNVEYFNLDAILSVGYRVNSKQGTQFRIWATQTLRDHLLRGYTLNEKRLRERGLEEAEQAIDLLSSTLRNQSLVTEQGRAVLDVVHHYARTWRLLLEYDEDRLAMSPASPVAPSGELTLKDARAAIDDLRIRSLAATNRPTCSAANVATSSTAFLARSSRHSTANLCMQRRKRAQRTFSTSSSRIIRSSMATSASAHCCSFSICIATACWRMRTANHGSPTMRWLRWRCWWQRAVRSRRS